MLRAYSAKPVTTNRPGKWLEKATLVKIETDNL